MYKTIILILIAAVLLGGCATSPVTGQEASSAPVGGEAASPRSGAPESPPEESEPRLFETKTELPKDVLIAYRRSGGMAGVEEEWLIYLDGRVTKTQGGIASTEGSEWQVPAEQVEALIDKITELGFFELKGNYMPLDTCCDRFTHELTVRSGSQVNQVVTIDAAKETPAELWQVLDEVKALLDQAMGIK